MSLMGGLDFDIGFSFDKFEENVKRFIELPINYLDTAVDTAVEFMEDIHERMFAPSPSDEALNKANEILKDSFYDNVITGSSATSVRMEFVASNKELSSPSTSTVTAEDSFAGSVVADAPETESILTKSPGLLLIKACVGNLLMSMRKFFQAIQRSPRIPAHLKTQFQLGRN
ncbi:hypothetical protein EE612_001064 [Oryza sativa]|nr:hypothetical protein EE612_001064 [Oryza sativa]